MGDWRADLEAIRVRLEQLNMEEQTMQDRPNAIISADNEDRVKGTQRGRELSRPQIYAIGRDLDAALVKLDRMDSEGRPIFEYKDGNSDESIAAVHGLHPGTIVKLRVEMFGRLKRSDVGESHYSNKLAARVDDLEQRLERLEHFVTIHMPVKTLV